MVSISVLVKKNIKQPVRYPYRLSCLTDDPVLTITGPASWTHNLTARATNINSIRQTTTRVTYPDILVNTLPGEVVVPSARRSAHCESALRIKAVLVTQVMKVPHTISTLVMPVTVNHHQSSTTAIHPVASPALLLLVSKLAPHATLPVPHHRVFAPVFQWNTITLTYPGADSV